MKKTCQSCNQEVASHFFINDICIPCANNAGQRAEPEPTGNYEVVEEVGCAGGGCSL